MTPANFSPVIDAGVGVATTDPHDMPQNKRPRKFVPKVLHEVCPRLMLCFLFKILIIPVSGLKNAL